LGLDRANQDLFYEKIYGFIKIQKNWIPAFAGMTMPIATCQKILADTHFAEAGKTQWKNVQKWFTVTALKKTFGGKFESNLECIKTLERE
jgi:hypothetical protein